MAIFEIKDKKLNRIIRNMVDFEETRELRNFSLKNIGS